MVKSVFDGAHEGVPSEETDESVIEGQVVPIEIHQQMQSGTFQAPQVQAGSAQTSKSEKLISSGRDVEGRLIIWSGEDVDPNLACGPS